MVDFFFQAAIYNMFIGIFGNPLLAGVFILIFFYIMGVAFRLTFEAQMVMMTIVSLIVINLFIPQLAIVMMLVVGVFVGLFLFYRILSR